MSDRADLGREPGQGLTAEIAQRRLDFELRASHEIDALNRVTGQVVHNFNNLLTTIGVYTELVLSRLADDSPLREEMLEILRASDQATELARQLLTLTQQGGTPTDLIDLNAVVEETEKTLRDLLGAEVEVTIFLDEDSQPILGNSCQIQQVLINLAVKAYHALPKGGRFTIETARRSAADLTAIGISPAPEVSEFVLLTATDTGVGMNAEQRARAFGPSAAHPDAALGLSIVREIVSRAGGHVRIWSEPDKGARFELYWPLGAPEDVDSTLTDASVRGERVLLVEDEESLRGVLHRVLEEGGYHVTTADSGERAVDIASRPGNHFDMVVADVVMPGMSGVELADRLQTSQSEAKILLISGDLNDSLVASVPSHIHLLAKPFSAVELSRRVRSLLDGAVDRAGD
jgi:hypothetical protein